MQLPADQAGSEIKIDRLLLVCADAIVDRVETASLTMFATRTADDDQCAGCRNGRGPDNAQRRSNWMTIIILQYGHRAVHFDRFSSREENSFGFPRRPCRADLQHLMSILGPRYNSF